MVAAQERYFSTYTEFAVSSGRRRYRIPGRCIGGRILDVSVFASTFEYRLARLHPTERNRADVGFIVDGADIILSQNINPGVLRIYYQLRPSTMSTSAVSVPVISVAGTIGVTAISSGTYDVISPSGLCQVLIPNVVYASSNFAPQPPDWINQATLSDWVAIGDLVVPQGVTTLVPLPVELHDVLAFRCAMRIKQMKGLLDDYNSLKSIHEEVEANAYNLITPRTENAEKAIRPLDMLEWGY